MIQPSVRPSETRKLQWCWHAASLKGLAGPLPPTAATSSTWPASYGCLSIATLLHQALSEPYCTQHPAQSLGTCWRLRPACGLDARASGTSFARMGWQGWQDWQDWPETGCPTCIEVIRISTWETAWLFERWVAPGEPGTCQKAPAAASWASLCLWQGNSACSEGKPRAGNYL